MAISKHTDVPFAPIPAELIEDKRLSLVAFKVACYILKHHPSWRVSVNDVSANTGFDRRNVTKAFDLLEACGYMTADRVSVGTRMCRTNISFSNKPEFTPRPLAEAAKVIDTTAAPAPPSIELPKPIAAKSLAELAKEDSAEGAEAYTKLVASTFLTGMKITTTDQPKARVGVRIKDGFVLSSIGTVLHRATPGDYAAFGQAQ